MSDLKSKRIVDAFAEESTRLGMDPFLRADVLFVLERNHRQTLVRAKVYAAWKAKRAKKKAAKAARRARTCAS